MGYEMALKCDGCGNVAPSIKMWRNLEPLTAQLLGNWVYEHSHCTDQYLFGGIEEPDEYGHRFTRLVEGELVHYNENWEFPVSNTKIPDNIRWTLDKRIKELEEVIGNG